MASGVSVVNALSDRLELEIWRDGEVWEQSYEAGKPKGKLKVTARRAKPARKLHFIPILRSSTAHKYNYEILARACSELAFLNKGLKITLTDERSDKSAEFRFTGGIAEFVKHLNKGKQVLHDSPVYWKGKKTPSKSKSRCSITTATRKTFLHLPTRSTPSMAARIFPDFVRR